MLENVIETYLMMKIYEKFSEKLYYNTLTQSTLDNF